MKNTVLFSLSILLFSCQPTNNSKELLNQIKALKIKISNVYKPGFGEFMGNIQVHHSKLWFAGKAKNWKLAAFEINELKENFKNLQKQETNRQESNMIPMIIPALNSMSNAIQNKDTFDFKNKFQELTATCVSCHQATGFEFIQIQIPNFKNFSNQKFKLKE